MGRKRLEITPDAIATIETYASRGATLDAIAIKLDVSPSTLDRWLTEPQVKRAYQRGKLEACEGMASRLWAIAHQNDDLRAATTAAIFWLKAQAQWTEKHETMEQGDRNDVIIYLPDNGRDKKTK